MSKIHNSLFRSATKHLSSWNLKEMRKKRLKYSPEATRLVIAILECAYYNICFKDLQAVLFFMRNKTDLQKILLTLTFLLMQKTMKIKDRFIQTILLQVNCSGTLLNLLICTLISENQGLEKSKSASNLQAKFILL